MAAPRSHAQTDSLNPAAAITSGSVINGPTPIISSMLKATAERRPMRRWRGLAELELGKFTRLVRSPDCTLTGDMIRFDRVQRAVTGAVLAGLMLAGTHGA